MASERATAVIRVGPFVSIDATTSPLYTTPGTGAFALNVDTTRQLNGFSTAKGRTPVGSFSGANLTIEQLNQFINQSETEQRFILGSLLLSGILAGGVQVYDIQTGSASVVSGGLAYTQGVQFDNALYTNASQQYRYYSGTMSAYVWQQPPPTDLDTNSFTLAQTPPGSNNIGPGTYYYTWTRLVTFPDGTTQETSPNTDSAFNLTVQTTVSSSGAQSIDLTPSSMWSGTFADGSTWTTNIYRQSSNQSIWLYVATLSGSSVYHDTHSDTAISVNVQLNLHNDPPPVSSTSPNKNLGPIFAHKDRMWAWVVVQNANTDNLVQSQLWFSAYGIPWSFNDAQGVLLVGNEFPFDLPNGTGQGLYDRMYGDIPVAGVSLSSIAVLHSRRATFVVYGDDPSTFIVRKMSDIGCIAPNSVAVCKNIEARLTDEGVYLFDGQNDTYISEPIRAILSLLMPTNLAQAVGWYANRSYYLSVPGTGGSTVISPTTGAPCTFVYYFPTGQWRILPYATNAAYSVPSEDAPQGSAQFQEIIAARYITSPAGPTLFFDSWDNADTDLGSAISGYWNSPVTDSGLPETIKTYTHVTINAPIQPGVSATVTLTIDPGSTPAKVYTWTFDLGLGPTLIAEVPVGTNGAGNLGYLAFVSVETTNTVYPNPLPTVIYSVSVYGTMAYNLIPSNVGVS